VCGGPELAAEEVLERLQVLVDNSLAHRTLGSDDDPHFGMLETVREYALEQLETAGEGEAHGRRHAAYFLALAEQAEPELHGADQRSWLDRLDRELDNLRAALSWAHEAGQTELGLRLAGAIGRFWWTRRYVGEGREWLERFLEADRRVEGAAAARACYAAGVLGSIQGDQAQAVRRLEQSIALYQAVGDTLGAVRALNSRGGAAYDQGHLTEALALWEQALIQARATSNLGEVAHALGNQGEARFHLGDLAGAEQCHTEALALARQAGRTDIEAMQLGNLGNVARRRGDLTRATDLQFQALTLKRELGARRQIAITLADLASIAGAQGHGIRAARLLAAAIALREAIGTPPPVPEWTATQQAVAAALAELSEEARTAAFAFGRALTLEQAIAYAVEEAPSSAARVVPATAAAGNRASLGDA
jgi:tetratricopeptide (TPR) repeat protein